ncbi:hypothetical protein DAPPUDRAFT_259406 [Daphnia pulex]|uniref:Uncharacterized protein n=1 Tax=Daphnia pulex TaxID=6669 RepID=E9HH70_DAPPU|nr:hypothetical protein DAPPUDRAFT_259406 [Daphnia pulex]|eukprot:EFX68914.1 hypothetical protein DAPPUDRAFT_259406 [Daphnia pulex]
MPRGRNSELSRELRRSVLEERQIAATIERELARQRRRVVHQEPYRRVAFRQAVPPSPQYIESPPYNNVLPERQPQLFVTNGQPRCDPPPPLRADEPPTQRPEIATLAHDAGAVAHGLATAKFIPVIHPARESAEDVLQLAIDEEIPLNE